MILEGSISCIMPFLFFTEMVMLLFATPSNFHLRCLVTNPCFFHNPALSKINAWLPSIFFRSPLPTICIYNTNDWVGRASCTTEISGQSKPSVNICTLDSTFILPVLKSSIIVFRSVLGFAVNIRGRNARCLITFNYCFGMVPVNGKNNAFLVISMLNIAFD